MKDRKNLIEENTGLVHACARKFLGRGAEYDDLFSCGCVGLVKAARGFDESLGFRFSTYAVPVILGEIKRYFRDGGAVKMSRSLKELSLKITRFCEEYEMKKGFAPTVKEIAAYFEISQESAAEALEASQLPLSLSYETDEEYHQTDIVQESGEEAITEKMTLHKLIEDLPVDDRELIKLRYFRSLTQSVTAEKLGMTQVQVSRREKKILLMLREKMKV